MRRLQIFVDKYGPVVGPRLFQVLQSQAGHASVAARLRRKIEAIRERGERPLPLFEHPATPSPEPLNRDGDRLGLLAAR